MEAVQPTSTAAEVAPAIAGNVTSAEVPVVDKQNDQPEEAAVNAGENTEIQHAEPPSSDPQQAAPQPQETADGKNPQQEPEAPPAPAMPSDDAVVSRLRELLKEVDLGVTTGESPF